jgi:hypothetical protein
VRDLNPIRNATSLRDLYLTNPTPAQLRAVQELEQLQINGKPHAAWAAGFVRNGIFVSYAHAQAPLLDELTQMLAPVLRKHVLPYWSDRDIAPGDTWRDEITDKMERARVAVLLVTKEFLASVFVTSVELPYLLQAAREHRVTLLWVPVNHAMYEETELADLQAVLDPNQPLEELEGASREHALKKVALAVVRAHKSGPRYRTPENVS